MAPDKLNRRRPPLALAYHGVAALPARRDRFKHFVSPAALRRHIRLLRAWGYELVTFRELAARVREGRGGGSAALTFDDGFADNLTALAPLLAEAEAPATTFVVSGWLGKLHPHVADARLLTAPEVRALYASGVEIGAHTVSHPDLTELPYDDVVAELTQCRRELERVIDAPVTTFAYPFGRATDHNTRACGAAGFSAACLTTGQGSWSEPLRLPRQDMINGSTSVGLWLKRDDRYERLVRRRGVRTVHRAAHRLRGNLVTNADIHAELERQATNGPGPRDPE